MPIYDGSGALVQNSIARLGIGSRAFGRAGKRAREDLERMHGEASSLYAAWMLNPKGEYRGKLGRNSPPALATGPKTQRLFIRGLHILKRHCATLHDQADGRIAIQLPSDRMAGNSACSGLASSSP